MGLTFLRHVERTSLLLHLLDVSRLNPRDPVQDYKTLNRELNLFSPKLAQKPQIVAVNKVDTPEAAERLPALERYFKRIRRDIFLISALTGAGLPSLLGAVTRELATLKKEPEP